MPKVKVIEKANNVHAIKLKFDSLYDHQSFLLVSDIHLDNPKCRRDILKRHLKQAENKNARVLMFGDILCLMQGRNDRRGSKTALTAKQIDQPYFDAVLDDAAKFFAPYKHMIDVIGYGNHETAIIRHNEFDPLKNLVMRLNQNEGSPVFTGGYGGWIYFQGESSQKRSSLKMKYHHGSGGNSTVTKGAIQQQRAAAMYDADIVVQGHIHQRQVTHQPKERLSNSGQVEQFEQVSLRLPTYKDAWKDGAFGWEVEKALGPSPIGGWWLDIFWHKSKLKFTYSPTD